MYIFKTAKGTQPPTQPEGKLTLAYVITVPSVDPDGNPVTYSANGQSDTGDDVTHEGLIPVSGMACQVDYEIERIEKYELTEKGD